MGRPAAKPFLWLDLWAFLLAACGSGNGTSSHSDATADGGTRSDTNTAEAGKREAGATDSQTDSSSSVEFFTYTEGAGLENAATGDFSTPALVYGYVEVPPHLEHTLTFLMTPFLPPSRVPVPSHGPVVVFSDDFETMVFSPADNFFSSLVWLEDGRIYYGLHGDIDSTPADFTHRFIITKGQGIVSTIEQWGQRLLSDRGKEPIDRYADTGLSTLGYWTDNGAHYYYNTEPGMNEEETLLAVKKDADESKIDQWGRIGLS